MLFGLTLERCTADAIRKPKDLVGFGTVGLLDGPQRIVSQGLASLFSRGHWTVWFHLA